MATDDEVSGILSGYRVDCARVDMEDVAILSPPYAGRYRLSIQSGLPRSAVKYVKLHEACHVVSGDIDEPTFMHFDGPMPMAEDAADLVALLGIVDPAHDDEGADWIEQQIRCLVPLDDRGWQVHRIPRLARKLPRVRDMVRDLHGYF